MQNSNENIKSDNTPLNDTQRYILDVMRCLVDVFGKLGISYYMQGGTMLGAVRHKGFIPWDDDIDIGVTRDNYDRILREVPANLPENLELRTYWDETDHHYYFSRIVDKRYKVKRMGGMEVRYENVWVDIFPLDGMPNGIIARNFHKFRLLVHRAKYHIACLEKVNIKRPGRSLLERMIIRVAAALHMNKWFCARKQLDKVDKLLKKYPIEKSDYVVNFMGQTSYHFDEMFRKEIYGKTVYYPFEDLSLPGPENYNEYLSSLYGDYMKPPKEEDRNAHVAQLIRENTDED